MLNIINDYIEKVKDNIDKKINFTIKPIARKPIFLSINAHSKISDLYEHLSNKYPEYKDMQFFLIRNGNIIDSDELVVDYEKEEALYLIKKV